MSKRKCGVFRQPRQDYATDMSVSQMHFDRDSLCKVSSYEISWHSTYTLPKISSLDKFHSISYWLNKNGLGDIEEPKNKVILKEIISWEDLHSSIGKTESTKCLDTINKNYLIKRHVRMALKRTSSFIKKLKEEIAKKVGESSSGNLKIIPFEKLLSCANIQQQVWRTQSESDVNICYVKSVDVGTEPPSCCKIPTMDTSVGTECTDVQPNDKLTLEWKFINKNITSSVSSTTVIEILKEGTFTQYESCETTHDQVKTDVFDAVSNTTIAEAPTVSPNNSNTPNKKIQKVVRKKNSGTFKTKAKVSCLYRKNPKKLLKQLDENIKSIPDKTTATCEIPKPSRNFPHKSDSQVCSTKRRPNCQTKYSEPSKNKITTKAMASKKLPNGDLSIDNKMDTLEYHFLNLIVDGTRTNIIHSNKTKAGDGPDSSAATKLDKERCENHSLFINNIKNYIFGAESLKIEKNEKVCNMEVQTIKSANSEEALDKTQRELGEAIFNNNEHCFVSVNQTTQTPTPEKKTQKEIQKPSFKIKNTETKSLKKSDKRMEVSDIGTQMYDYLTPSELYCREWIQRNLFHIDDLNPSTIIIDCRTNNDSTKSSMTSSGSVEPLSNAEYATQVRL